MARAKHTPEADLPFELPRVSARKRTRAVELLDALEAEYPDAHCELNYATPHELLVATILSAQSTDVGVNKATPALFKQYPSPAALAKADLAEIETLIRSLGFFRSKARAVKESMTRVVEVYGGEVPRTMDDLLTLRGVARKTANVVLGNAFGINVGIPVDTHVQRLSRRFDLAPEGSNVAAIERHLMALFPRERWCKASHLLIWHGRRACGAKVRACVHPICTKFGTCCETRSA